MSSHWFLKDGHKEFRECLGEIFDEAAVDLCRPDARSSLGDEHDQCQAFFVKAYTLMRERERNARVLTSALLCCSKIADPVLVLRYYRSRVRRSSEREEPQFIESETGADFALTIQVNLPGVLRAERSVLGQGKILEQGTTSLDVSQLQTLLRVAGPESGAYMIWGAHTPPTVLTAEIVDACQRGNGRTALPSDTLLLGKPMSEFFSEEFLGLWFGKNYVPEREGDTPPPDSIGVLFHYLHRGSPPPNVVHIGISSTAASRFAPGVYIHEPVDIDR